MISFKNVTYKIKNKIILNDITFNIKDGEKVLIVGKSGSGKTTIFSLLNLNIYPSHGSIYVDNQNIINYSEIQKSNYLKSKVRLILQEDDLYPNMSVNNNLLLFYEQDIIDLYLKKGRLYHLKNRLVSNLSGGERQRISIIKSCMCNSDILLCDEITSALDDKTAMSFIHFILDLFKDKTIIFISHTSYLFDGLIDRYIYLESNEIKQVIINDISCKAKHKNTIKEKSYFKILLRNGIKKTNIFLLLIFILSTITFSFNFNYNDIFSYIANRSMKQYYDYNIYEIINNNSINEESNHIVLNLKSSLMETSLYIDDIKYSSIELKPFINDKSYDFVITKSLIDSLNIQNITSISLLGKSINFKSNNLYLIDEDAMFSTSCIYYNYYKIRSNIKDIKGNDYLYISDHLVKDDMFTNNPLFEGSKEDKPYLESNAYLDFLTYQMVFNSINSIIKYYFIMILFYSLITSFLLVISNIKKDLKHIAILLSKGINIYQILLSNIIPILIYITFSCLLSIFIPIRYFYKGLLLSSFILLLTNVIALYYIKKQNLHELLKEDFLC